MTPNELIGLGEICCPSCKSDNWKSSKLIVLENVSNIEGTISGEISELGILSGNAKAFFLSDRWFTWEKDVDLDVKLSTSNGLVDEVKRLMLSYSNITEMPEPPQPLGFFERVNPKKPKKPVLLELEKNIDEPLYIHFLRGTIRWGIVIGIVTFLICFFDSYFGYQVDFESFYLFAMLLMMPVIFIRSFSGNARNQKQYEWMVKTYPKLKDKHIKDLEKYEIDYYKYQAECKQKELQDTNEKNKQLQYEEKKQNAIMARELLWQRSRICMRCGTAYIGQI